MKQFARTGHVKVGLRNVFITTTTSTTTTSATASVTTSASKLTEACDSCAVLIALLVSARLACFTVYSSLNIAERWR